jgi:flagellar assembly protein FliH
MSSRLLDPGEAAGVEAIEWRLAGSGESGAGFPGMRPGGGLKPGEQIEQRIRDAHAAGLREGEASGQRKGAAELQPVIQRLCRSIEEIGGLRARLRREAEEDLVRLALAIARRILGRELSVDPDAIRTLALGALERLRGQEISRVRVHPAQQPAVAGCLREMNAGTAVEVKADPGCAPGTVVLETERGRLDVSVESQLQEIERGLTDRLRRQP